MRKVERTKPDGIAFSMDEDDEELLVEEFDAEEDVSKVDPLKCEAYGPGLEAARRCDAVAEKVAFGD